MNPYFATAFLSALVFWIWPAFLYRTLDAHLLVILGFAAAIFVGLGRLASEIHVRYIAPRRPPKGRYLLIGVACVAIFAVAALTRFVYDAGTRA
jgi:hypothetical protein